MKSSTYNSTVFQPLSCKMVEMDTNIDQNQFIYIINHAAKDGSMRNRQKNGGRKTRTGYLKSIVQQNHPLAQVRDLQLHRLLLQKVTRNHNHLRSSVCSHEHF